MDYRQFMKIMQEGDESGKEAVTVLQDFVKEFPYFQSAQSLLAKSMHEQQHVRYERQLKIASAYSVDRKLLYDMMHTQKENILRDIPVSDPSPLIETVSNIDEEEKTSTETKIFKSVPEIKEEIVIDFPTFSKPEQLPPVSFYNSETENDELESDFDELPVADPHDIIRRRLVEILGLREEPKEEVKIVPGRTETETETESKTESKEISDIKIEKIEDLKAEKTIDDKIISEEKNSTKDVIEQLAAESTKAVDFLQKAELEYALESTLIHSLEKLPVIESSTIKEKSDFVTEEKKESTFYDWLKIKSASGFGKIEEVHAYKSETIYSPGAIFSKQENEETFPIIENDEKKGGDIVHLIDRFIETDPKIVPSKADFYSPAIQAKKSITENEDLVSETLAKIYHKQGNLLKARSSYQKLSLLYPEKLAYFAALISELEKEINNLDKQDL